jgi:hypothetical protein
MKCCMDFLNFRLFSSTFYALFCALLATFTFTSFNMYSLLYSTSPSPSLFPPPYFLTPYPLPISASLPSILLSALTCFQATASRVSATPKDTTCKQTRWNNTPAPSTRRQSQPAVSTVCARVSLLSVFVCLCVRVRVCLRVCFFVCLYVVCVCVKYAGPSQQPHLHTHTHTHTHIHTHIHTCTHMHTHTHTHTDKHTHTYTHAHTCTHTHTYTQTHTRRRGGLYKSRITKSWR